MTLSVKTHFYDFYMKSFYIMQNILWKENLDFFDTELSNVKDWKQWN